MFKTSKRMKQMYLLLAGCQMVVGILMVMLSDRLMANVCAVFGIFLMAYGIVKLFGYFSKDLFQLAFQFDIALGVVFIIVGILLLQNRTSITDRVAFISGVVFILDAAMKLQTAIEAKKFGLENWWTILIAALTVLITGNLLLFLPLRGISPVSNMIGLNLLFDGIMNIIVIANTVRAARGEGSPEV